MSDSNDFIQAATASRHLNRTPATVRHYADSGRLPVTRTLDGVRLFRYDDVLKLKAEIEAEETKDRQVVGA